MCSISRLLLVVGVHRHYCQGLVTVFSNSLDYCVIISCVKYLVFLKYSYANLSQEQMDEVPAVNDE